MIRRILDFLLILIFVWACMLLGFWIIDVVIVPWHLPFSSLISNIVKPLISLLLVIFWLWLWKKIVENIFWTTLKRR
ncbi:MAG: hypothetical protein ACE5NN_03070 [Candidatus Bathyarchaeia archaeon]